LVLTPHRGKFSSRDGKNCQLLGHGPGFLLHPFLIEQPQDILNILVYKGISFIGYEIGKNVPLSQDFSQEWNEKSSLASRNFKKFLLPLSRPDCRSVR
jgi:hypothetical protein